MAGIDRPALKTIELPAVGGDVFAEQLALFVQKKR